MCRENVQLEIKEALGKSVSRINLNLGHLALVFPEKIC